MPNLHTLHPDRRFTQISNEALDQLPSMEGAGYLAHLLRHQDGYVPNLDKLVEQKPGVTKRAASKARAEVMRYGYYVSVRFKHSAGGQFATDIWRSVYPHTADDLDEIARRYQPGNTTQIPQLDVDKQPRRDAQGNVLMRQVTIQWARVDSWRGQQRVGDKGQLCAPDTDANTNVSRAEPVGARPPGSGTSARPAKTGVSPGGSEVPDSGGSGARGVGEREVFKKTRENTTQEDQPNEHAPSLRSGALWVTRPSIRRPGDTREVESGADGSENQSKETAEPQQVPTPAPEAASAGSVAEALLTDERLHEGLVAIDLLPATKPHQRKQYAKLVKAIDAALLRFPEAQVKHYLWRKIGERKGVKWVIVAFTDYADAIKQEHLPNEGGHTDFGDDGFLETVANEAASREQATRRTTGQTKARRQHEQQPATDESAHVSPVDWLSDRQFDGLKPQDKACIRAHGNTPEDQLKKLTAKQIARIKATTEGVAA